MYASAEGPWAGGPCVLLAFSNWQLLLFNADSELIWHLLCSCKCAIYGYCYYIPILQMKKLRHKDVK